MPRHIMPCRSKCVCIPIRRRSIGVSGLLHHRISILRSFEAHKLSVRVLLSAPSRRQQIHEESKDVESEDERDGPFENGGYILSTIERGDCKDDCKDYLHDDK